MKVIIDSGHGGSDPGAVAFGVKEKDLNIIFTNLLASQLQQLNFEVDKSLINDKNYTPNELTDLIKKSGAKLCISCHNNAFNGSASGFEVIHSIHTDGKLAKLILEEVKKTNFPIRRAFSRKSTLPSSVEQDYYYIIRLTYPQVETLIVEFGFMDNKDDFKMLTDPEWQKRLTSAVALAISKYASPLANNKTSILGESILRPSQLKSALKAANNQAILDIVDIYYNIAPIYGIKADLAFIQCLHETGWLKFTGVVKPHQNNFAGLGATGASNPGLSFTTISVGVEAHLQHLYAYASTKPLPTGRTLYNTRFALVIRGSAPNWEDLNGKWAVPGVGYGERIVELQKTILEKYLPNIPKNPPVIQPVHWAKHYHDELFDAGLLNTDHTSTLDEPASKAMVFALISRLRKELMNND
ncbi:N-acetylmuramoyl-L-alanine amidase [Serpentinicella alkaliphila]|uniref:N-acetylmuramoyl-L-alanine amidase n=1 Tax=Serpentinicella alkaliphila TaxID=1734049 RepID=A0A4R2SXB8_9FIRM|nr:N-acetylmuramoyl-L-alanine amidase [Serpentinicella alkaliphila]TCP93286.1 N-acetylmuramoyl-L-alanine amidase [Serpentinicella alkaliphila]